MKKRSKVITSTLITIIVALLCATILITAITHRDWFSRSSYTSSNTSSEVETIIIEETIIEETSSIESIPQETTSTSSQNPTPSNQPTGAQSIPEAPSASPTLIPKEPLPEGVVCGYDWLDNIARAATEEELNAYMVEEGWSPYCEYCGRPTMAMSVDGKLFVCGAIYGTCLRYFAGGDRTCACCGAVVPVNTCHTCGVPIIIEPLPGTTINSPDQLSEKDKKFLYEIARANIIRNSDGNDEKLISLYSFIITDTSALSTRSKCVCFFVFSESGSKFENPIYDPIYHYGAIYDISVLEDGNIKCASKYDDIIMFPNEEEVVEYFQKIGTNITKIG